MKKGKGQSNMKNIPLKPAEKTGSQPISIFDKRMNDYRELSSPLKDIIEVLAVPFYHHQSGPEIP